MPVLGSFLFSFTQHGYRKRRTRARDDLVHAQNSCTCRTSAHVELVRSPTIVHGNYKNEIVERISRRGQAKKNVKMKKFARTKKVAEGLTNNWVLPGVGVSTHCECNN